MPRYKMRIEGKDLVVPAHKGPPVCGFFVTRLIDAGTLEEAHAKGLAMIEQDWTFGPFAHWKQAPSLAIVESGKAPPLSWLFANLDYVFHRGK